MRTVCSLSPNDGQYGQYVHWPSTWCWTYHANRMAVFLESQGVESNEHGYILIHPNVFSSSTIYTIMAMNFGLESWIQMKNLSRSSLCSYRVGYGSVNMPCWASHSLCIALLACITSYLHALALLFLYRYKTQKTVHDTNHTSNHPDSDTYRNSCCL